jgi:AbrB family transcriptional regulator (stage V sporulation protein T)
MKATGIVRRIDDLGRVVIPKEIRRTLRIREGDPLEIFTEKDGEVIFKKYSPMGELSEFAGQICETMHKTTNRITAIADRDSIISVSGVPKRELGEKRISGELEQVMEGRQVFQEQTGEKELPIVDGESPYRVSIAAPIISEGDVLGCVMFLHTEGAQPAGEVENKLAATVARFLGKQMEA